MFYSTAQTKLKAHHFSFAYICYLQRLHELRAGSMPIWTFIYTSSNRCLLYIEFAQRFVFFFRLVCKFVLFYFAWVWNYAIFIQSERQFVIFQMVWGNFVCLFILIIIIIHSMIKSMKIVLLWQLIDFQWVSNTFSLVNLYALIFVRFRIQIRLDRVWFSLIFCVYFFFCLFNAFCSYAISFDFWFFFCD